MPETMQRMLVSRFAERGGVTADTVRYYERIGLLPEADRDPNGYRCYAASDVDRLVFIKNAQRFGLSLEDVRELLAIRDEGACPCGHADELLQQRLAQLDEQISTLQLLRGDIASLLENDVSTAGTCRLTLVPMSTRTEGADDG